MVDPGEIQPDNFTISPYSQVKNGTNFELILYLLEEADFLCVTLVLFFLRGQAPDWSLTPLPLKARARIKNMSSIQL